MNFNPNPPFLPLPNFAAGHEDAIMEAMIGEVMSLFHKSDANNDNIMNMDEFFGFAQHMYDASAFFLRSTRVNADDTGFDVIEQKEWDCAQNENGDGLEYPNCNSNAADGQILVRKHLSLVILEGLLWIIVHDLFVSIQIADMVGNADGDNVLTLWEFL